MTIIYNEEQLHVKCYWFFEFIDKILETIRQTGPP